MWKSGKGFATAFGQHFLCRKKYALQDADNSYSTKMQWGATKVVEINIIDLHKALDMIGGTQCFVLAKRDPGLLVPKKPMTDVETSKSLMWNTL
jgi:hypothetical protein